MINVKTSTTWLHRVVSYVGAIYLHFVGKTSFVFMVDDPAAMDIWRNKKKCIFAFWHNNQVFLAYHHRNESVNIMVSRSTDGEYIAQVMRRMGLNAVRGSSTRGGGRALREVCNLLQKGEQCGFTPDGPKGPVQTVHGGIVTAAQLTGSPIVPTAVYSRRKWVFNSWDKFFVPLPFSTIVVAHGRPLFLKRELSLEEAQEQVRKALNDTAQLVEREGEAKPAWMTSFVGQLLFWASSMLTWLLSPFLFSLLLLKFGIKKTLPHIHERFRIPETSAVASTSPKLWLHAASVGEWQAMKPVLAELKRTTDASFIITTTTNAAKRLISAQEPQIPVSMCPVDLSPVVNQWILQARPDALVIIESELWPQIIHALYRKHIPVFIINGRFSSKAVKSWSWVKPLSQKIMSEISWFFARTTLDGIHFVQSGAFPERIEVLGNTKYDNMPLLSAEDRRRKRNEWFGPVSGSVLIGGSTWPGEEKPLIDLLKTSPKGEVRLILAPRRIERAGELLTLAASLGISCSRWSEVKKSKRWETDILLVDTLGDLKGLYAAADIAFIGGSLVPRGGQNPLEPAAAGLPVIFGAFMENFHEEAQGLIRENGAHRVQSEDELVKVIGQIALSGEVRYRMGMSAQAFVRSKQGASVFTVLKMKEKLNI